MPPREFLTGRVFGRLTVIDDSLPSPNGRVRKALCSCSCGSQKAIRVDHLRGGKIQSCGCLLDEIRPLTQLKHGHARKRNQSATYGIWRGILKRCLDPTDHNYERYGGRGIKVCDRWRSFEAFLSDMGQRPSGLSIERNDNNGDYEPTNCRWATRKEQNSNKRNNHIIEHDGLSLTITEWARRSGINHSTIIGRLRRGWSPAAAVQQRTCHVYDAA